MATSTRKRGRPCMLSDSDRKRKKHEADHHRNRAKIYIGDAIDRWNTLKEEKGFVHHYEVARFLLKCYIKMHSHGAETSEPPPPAPPPACEPTCTCRTLTCSPPVEMSENSAEMSTGQERSLSPKHAVPVHSGTATVPSHLLPTESTSHNSEKQDLQKVTQADVSDIHIKSEPWDSGFEIAENATYNPNITVPNIPEVCSQEDFETKPIPVHLYRNTSYPLSYVESVQTQPEIVKIETQRSSDIGDVNTQQSSVIQLDIGDVNTQQSSVTQSNIDDENKQQSSVIQPDIGDVNTQQSFQTLSEIASMNMQQTLITQPDIANMNTQQSLLTQLNFANRLTQQCLLTQLDVANRLTQESSQIDISNKSPKQSAPTQAEVGTESTQQKLLAQLKNANKLTEKCLLTHLNIANRFTQQILPAELDSDDKNMEQGLPSSPNSQSFVVPSNQNTSATQEVDKLASASTKECSTSDSNKRHYISSTGKNVWYTPTHKPVPVENSIPKTPCTTQTYLLVVPCTESNSISTNNKCETSHVLSSQQNVSLTSESSKMLNTANLNKQPNLPTLPNKASKTTRQLLPTPPITGNNSTQQSLQDHFILASKATKHFILANKATQQSLRSHLNMAKKNTSQRLPTQPIVANNNTPQSLPPQSNFANNNILQSLPTQPIVANNNMPQSLQTQSIIASQTSQLSLPKQPIIVSQTSEHSLSTQSIIANNTLQQMLQTQPNIANSSQQMLPVQLDNASSSQQMLPIQPNIANNSQQMLPVQLNNANSSQQMLPVQLNNASKNTQQPLTLFHYVAPNGKQVFMVPSSLNYNSASETDMKTTVSTKECLPLHSSGKREDFTCFNVSSKHHTGDGKVVCSNLVTDEKLMTCKSNSSTTEQKGQVSSVDRHQGVTVCKSSTQSSNTVVDGIKEEIIQLNENPTEGKREDIDIHLSCVKDCGKEVYDKCSESDSNSPASELLTLTDSNTQSEAMEDRQFSE